MKQQKKDEMTKSRGTIAASLCTLFALTLPETSAFAPIGKTTNNVASHSTCDTRIFGISEWRDQCVSFGGDRGMRMAQPADEGLPRNLQLLRADSSEVVLQGQTKYFYFNSDEEVRLFQQAIDCNEGIFGLGLVSTNPLHGSEETRENEEEAVLLDKVPLMEIQDYNIMGVDHGIFCSAKAVGRAVVLQTQLHESDLGDDSEPMTVLCAEYYDRLETKSIEEARELALKIQKMVAEISNVELSSRLLDRIGQSNDEDDDEPEPTRLDRFLAAYQEALDADAQGYTSIPEDAASGLSWRELDAISWAAFSTSAALCDDETYRLAALDISRLTDRLLLANYWLSDVLIEAKQATFQ